MIERELTPYDGNSSRDITAEQAALIEERRDYLRVVHREQFPGPSLVHDPSPRTIAGAIWQRELGFGKLALLSRGAALLDYWPAIERERNIPPSVLAWESTEGILVAQNWEGSFYRTVYPADQIATEVELYGGRWIFGTVEGLPSFSLILEQEALRFYHHIGGVLPHVGHMSVGHISERWVGGRSAFASTTVSGGVPPYSYAMSPDSPSWITALAGPSVRIAPPVLTERATYVGHLLVTDSLGLVVDAPVTVTVE